jgi:hypothetical protein
MLSEVNINNHIYNGVKKVEVANKNVMDLQSEKECTKIKNSGGFDRIPQRVLVDGLNYLLAPFMKDFLLGF